MTTETPHKPDSLKQEPSKPSLISEDALKLCHEIERLPASEQQTKLSVMASGLRQRIVEETVQLIPSQENQILELVRAKGHAVEFPCSEVATGISELINRFWPSTDAEDSAFTSAKAHKDATLPQYQIKDFYGSVILKDWVPTLDNRQVKTITGRCTLVKDEELAGFKTRGNESNWGMRVCGQGQQWTIFGCQIRAVIAHEKATPGESMESRLVLADGAA